MKNILKIFIIGIVIINLISIYAIALNTGPYNPFNGSVSGTSNVAMIGRKVVFVFQVIGSFCAVGILGWIGIQYMISSPSEKAELKERMVPYIVCAVCVFAIIPILQILYNIAQRF